MADILSGEVVITLVAILAFVVLSLVSARAQVRYRQLRHEETMAAIEKGADLPVDPSPGSPPAQAAPEPSNSLRTGLLTLGIGGGLIAALRLLGSEYWAWGLVVVGLGVAHMVYWLVMGKAEWERIRRGAPGATEIGGRDPASGSTAPGEIAPR